MRVTIIVLLGSLSAARADTLLDKGRALEQHGKHAEAIAAYEAYLRTAPDDPTANAELGFAALQARDYPKAEAATRAAIAHTKPASFRNDPTARVRAAALYNLGQIEEATGARADAARAYSESLAARSSRVVRERLEKLDPAAAAKADVLAPMPLAGPFATLGDACRDWLVRHDLSRDTTWGEHGSCDAVDRIAVGGTAALAAPFDEVAAFQMIDRSSLELGIHTRAGWFVFDDVGKGHRSQAHCGGTAFTVSRLGVVTRVVRQLAFDVHSTGSCFHHGHDWGWDERATIVVGVGASARPSAPPPLVTSQLEWSQADGPKTNDTQASLAWSWRADGTLDGAGHIVHAGGIIVTPGEDLDPEDLLGHHVVAFP